MIYDTIYLYCTKMNKKIYESIWLLKQLLANKDIYLLVANIYFNLLCDYVIDLNDIQMANHVRDSIYKHMTGTLAFHFNQRSTFTNDNNKVTKELKFLRMFGIELNKQCTCRHIIQYHNDKMTIKTKEWEWKHVD